MYPLRRCSSVRPTTNPVSSLTYVYGSGLQGKVPPIVKMVTTPREKSRAGEEGDAQKLDDVRVAYGAHQLAQLRGDNQ